MRRKPMSKAEIEASVRAYQTTGDVAARNRLVGSTSGLVRMIVRRYQACEETADDLMQEGFLGVMRAMETFDFSKKAEFNTYCVFWIRSFVGRYLERASRQSSPYMAGSKAVPQKEGSPPRRPKAQMVSLDAPVFRNPDCPESVIDFVITPGPSPEEAASTAQTNAMVRAVVAKAASQQRLHRDKTHIIIQDRLLADQPVCRDAVAERFGMSREWVRQLELELRASVKEVFLSGEMG